MNILVTGASGFVGSSLIPQLLESGHTVIALARSLEKVKVKHPRLKWMQGDLLKPHELTPLSEIDRAYYLVHGLKSDEDNFEFLEASAAVNFINWIRPTRASMIYLGALGARNKALSPHLRSRQLTGAILGSSGLGLIEFRASIIIGEGSVSFEMIKALTERLPIRPQMRMISEPCQPLALQDLLKYLEKAIEIQSTEHQIFEIGGPDVTSYGELLDLYAELSGIKRKTVKLPDVERRAIMKALEYVIPEHADVGKKLAESLDFATVVADKKASEKFPEIAPISLRIAMDLAKARSNTHYPPLWEKDFLKILLSDKILTQSGLLSPELLKNFEKVGKIKDIFSRR